ncbi:hypothetical protein HDE_10787 [Halotydeus destructor]|nr:hypothetical protein HDE_10787 [Halotydeus destructor]
MDSILYFGLLIALVPGTLAHCVTDLDCYPAGQSVCTSKPGIFGKACRPVKQLGQECEVKEQCTKTRKDLDCLFMSQYHQYRCTCNDKLKLDTATGTCVHLSWCLNDYDCSPSAPHCLNQRCGRRITPEGATNTKPPLPATPASVQTPREPQVTESLINSVKLPDAFVTSEDSSTLSKVGLWVAIAFPTAIVVFFIGRLAKASFC